MNMFKYILFIMGIFIFYGCNANDNSHKNKSEYSDTTIIFRNFPNEKKIYFSDHLKTDLNIVRGVMLTDSSIILTDDYGFKEGYFFWEFSDKTKNVIGKYIKGGIKKGMTLGPLCFGLTKDNILFVRDISLRKIILAYLNKKISFDSLETKEYSANDFNYTETLLDENRSIKSSILDSSENIVNIIDIHTDTIISKFGNFVAPPKGIPFGSWKHANMNFIYLKQDLSKIILASRYKDQIKIYDLNSKKGITMVGPENLELSFLPIKAGSRYLSQPTEKTYYTFRSGFATNKYIYLLYYGKTDDSKSHIDGDIIFIYDWNGNPINKLKLDRMIQGFAVSKDDEDIYAFDGTKKMIVTSKIK